MADTPDLGSGAFGVGVQVPPPALKKKLRELSPGLLSTMSRALIFGFFWIVLSCFSACSSTNDTETHSPQTLILSSDHNSSDSHHPKLSLWKDPRFLFPIFKLQRKRGAQFFEQTIFDPNNKFSSSAWSLASVRISINHRFIAAVFIESKLWRSKIVLLDTLSGGQLEFERGYVEDISFIQNSNLAFSTRKKGGKSILELHPLLTSEEPLVLDSIDDLSIFTFRKSTDGSRLFIQEHTPSWTRFKKVVPQLSDKFLQPLKTAVHIEDIDFFQEKVLLSGVLDGQSGLYQINRNGEIDWQSAGLFTSIRAVPQAWLVQSGKQKLDTHIGDRNGYLLVGFDGTAQSLPISQQCRPTVLYPSVSEDLTFPQFECSNLVSSPALLNLSSTSLDETMLKPYEIVPTKDPQTFLKVYQPATPSLRAVLLLSYGAYQKGIEDTYTEWAKNLYESGIVVATLEQKIEDPFEEDGTNRAPHRKLLAVKKLEEGARILKRRYPGIPLYLSSRSAGGAIALSATLQNPETFSRIFLDRPLLSPIEELLKPRSEVPYYERELKEWGDPNDPKQLFFMKKYDPTYFLQTIFSGRILIYCGGLDHLIDCKETQEFINRLKLSSPSARITLREEPLATHTTEPSTQARFDFEELVVEFFLGDL